MQMQRMSAWGTMWLCAAVCVSLGACADEAPALEAGTLSNPVKDVDDPNDVKKLSKTILVLQHVGPIVSAMDSLFASLNMFDRGDLKSFLRLMIHVNIQLFTALSFLITKFNSFLKLVKRSPLGTTVLNDGIDAAQHGLDSFSASSIAARGVTGGPTQPGAFSPQHKAALEVLESVIPLLNMFAEDPKVATSIRVLSAFRNIMQTSPRFVLDGVRVPNNAHSGFSKLIGALNTVRTKLDDLFAIFGMQPIPTLATKKPTTSGPVSAPSINEGNTTTKKPAKPMPTDSTHKPAPPTTESTTATTTTTTAPRRAPSTSNGRMHPAAIALCVAAAVVACCAVAVGVGRWRKAVAGARSTVSPPVENELGVELVTFGAGHAGEAGVAQGSSHLTSANAAADINGLATFY